MVLIKCTFLIRNIDVENVHSWFIRLRFWSWIVIDHGLFWFTIFSFISDFLGILFQFFCINIYLYFRNRHWLLRNNIIIFTLFFFDLLFQILYFILNFVFGIYFILFFLFFHSDFILLFVIFLLAKSFEFISFVEEIRCVNRDICLFFVVVSVQKQSVVLLHFR